MQHHQTLAAKKGSKTVAPQSLVTPLSSTSLPFIDNCTAGILQRKTQGWIHAEDRWAMAPVYPPINVDLPPAEPLTERTPPLQ